MQQLCRPCGAGARTFQTRGFTPGFAVARFQRWDLFPPRLKRMLYRAEAKSMRHWASRRPSESITAWLPKKKMFCSINTGYRFRKSLINMPDKYNFTVCRRRLGVLQLAAAFRHD